MVDYSNLRSEFRSNIGSNILSAMGTGGTLGSVLGPWGTVIGTGVGAIVGGVGSIVESESIDRKIAEAKNNNFRIKTVNGSIAQSLAMRNDWNNRYTNTYDQVRVGAWAGLDALTQEGEIRGSMLTKDNKEIRGGIPNVDSKIEENIRDDEYIIPKIYGLADMAMPAVKFLESLKNAVNKNKNPHNREIAWNSVKKSFNEAGEYVNSVAELTKELRNNDIIPKGDNDMPVHAAAGWDSVGVNLASGLIGAGLFASAYGQRAKYPNTRDIRNPYAPQAFDTLDRINIPMLPIVNLMKDAIAKEHQGIYNSGGLSSSQKLAANVALTSNSQSNIAKTMFDYYKQLNDIKAKTAQLKLGEGQHAALMMLNAAQWDLDYYSKAHAARQNMMNVGILNTIGSLRQIVADADKRRRWELMMGMWSDENNNVTTPKPTKKLRAIDAVDKVYNNSTIFNPSYDNVLPTTSDYLKQANNAADRLYKRLFS